MSQSPKSSPTITECSAALQGVAGAENALHALVAGSQWEHDPRVLDFWEQAAEVVAVIREAHTEAVRSAAQ